MRKNDGSAVHRGLLTNGEGLKVDVTPSIRRGGGKTVPYSSQEAKLVLLPQARSMVEKVRSIAPELRSSDRIYVEATLLPTYLSPSEFPDDLLSEIEAVPVGSRFARAIDPRKKEEGGKKTRRLILAVPDSGLQNLANLIETGGESRRQHDAFEEIKKVDSLEVATAVAGEDDHVQLGEEISSWEAVLNPSVNADGQIAPLDDETLEKWFRLVYKLGGEGFRQYTRRVGTLTFVPTEISSSSASHLRALFNPLRSLMPMATLSPFTSSRPTQKKRVLPPFDFGPISDRFTVGVFDTGIDVALHGGPFFPMGAVDITPVPSDPDQIQHGTAVTAAAMYGLVREGERAPTPPLLVESYRVYPVPSDVPHIAEWYWILDRIIETIKENPHLLVNLSCSPPSAINDQVPNRWTSDLDAISFEHEVLFVSAAGNNGEADFPADRRVQIPADMANGVTVGACNFPYPQAKWKRTNYSAIGPGRPGNRVQPTCVQFGGSDDKDFPALKADGSVIYDNGTSLAAPITVHALAELATRLPNPSPACLRAFLVHFAERHNKLHKFANELGYGRSPLSFLPFLNCSRNEIHVLYQGFIEGGQVLGYRLPLSGVSQVGLKFSFTLVFVSPTDPAEADDYTTAAIDLTFRPDARRYRYSLPDDKLAKVLDRNSAEAVGLLNAGWNESQEPATESLKIFGSPTATQLSGSNSWETVRYSQKNLGAGKVFEPRFELAYTKRRRASRTEGTTKIPFAVLVTIVDSSQQEDLYAAAVQNFTVLQPVVAANISVSVTT